MSKAPQAGKKSGKIEPDPEPITEKSSEPADDEPVTPAPSTDYFDAIEAYLADAAHLTALDGPMKVHVRALARSLDLQISKTGEVQSALASSFDKAMMRLESRRPAPPPAGPQQMPGQQSIGFGTLDDET